MTEQRWQRLKELVADALEEDSPAARTGLLQQECANDPELLGEIEALLTEHDTMSAGEDSLEECATAAGKALYYRGESIAGRRIGAYVLVRELGHGGMGTVYLGARADGYFEKQVAIKVLRPGSNPGDLLRRFCTEREVLAALEHANIAALFDAGTTEEGLPYFVMEYVPGTPVTRYVEEHNLSIDKRLQLFLKICAAVEAAHRKRIVHRDLKRSNILVTEEGEPKLLDFGISKLLEVHPHSVTATGEQRLTPISASPEQARGEPVTPSSDIYALGMLLYEMLTGTSPHIFSGSELDMKEVTRVVCEQIPALPSDAATDDEIQQTLRGDLDAIVLRAIEKEPARRYPTVSELADDVRRFLAGEPVKARPNRLSYRLARRFTKRKHLWLRLSWGTAAAIVITGVSFSFFRIRSHPAESVSGGNPQIPEKSIAVLPFDDFGDGDKKTYFADGVQDDILTDLAKVADLKVISRTGVAVYRKSERDIHEIGRKLGVAYVLEGSVRKAGDRVRVNAQLIDTRSDAQVWAEQYDRRISDLFALQSDLAQAIVGQLKGRLSASEKAAIESRPTSDVQAYDLYLQARAEFFRYGYRDAVALLGKAISRDPNFALAYCLLTDANVYLYRFGGDRSPERLARAKRAAETALRLTPELPEAHLAQAQYYYNGIRDYEKAEAELSFSPPSPAGRSRFFDLAALTERRLGHWKEALRDGQKAWELDPHDPFIATELIQTYTSLRRYREAEELAGRALTMITLHVAPFWSLKADAILAQGDASRARAFFAQAPENLFDKHDEMARIALFQRDFPAALHELEEARKGREIRPAAASMDLIEGSIRRAQKDPERARAAFDRARKTLEAKAPQQADDPTVQMNLAWAYAGLGWKKEALEASQKSVQLAPSWRDAAEGPMFAAMQAQVSAWVGEKDAAVAQLQRVVKLPASVTPGELKFDPGWDDLRDDPRFSALIAQADQPPLFE